VGCELRLLHCRFVLLELVGSLVRDGNRLSLLDRDNFLTGSHKMYDSERFRFGDLIWIFYFKTKVGPISSDVTNNIVGFCCASRRTPLCARVFGMVHQWRFLNLSAQFLVRRRRLST
jgi:hypothetical protein